MAVGYDDLGSHSQLRLSQLWACGAAQMAGPPGPSGRASALGRCMTHEHVERETLVSSLREGLVTTFFKVSLSPSDHLGDKIVLGVPLARAMPAREALTSTPLPGLVCASWQTLRKVTVIPAWQMGSPRVTELPKRPQRGRDPVGPGPVPSDLQRAPPARPCRLVAGTTCVSRQVWLWG